MNQRAVILHNRLSAQPTPDEADVLDQVELVKNALTELGYSCQVMDVGYDLYHDIQKIKRLAPAFVFNLVETVFGKSELLHVVPSLLASERIPYSGVSAEALFLTTNKLLAKRMMKQSGISTPDWLSTDRAAENLSRTKKYILKPISEEGSVKLDEDAVFNGDDRDRAHKISGLNPEEYFVEEFVDGREFNLSVTGASGDFSVYPVAEMIFENFPPDKERILGYRAKWHEDSFEYQHTRRQFQTLFNEPVLHESLIEITKKCGEVFRLSGYFRVDFRVAESGQPFVLEINGNPCIAPDSGFIAATAEAGLPTTEVISRIIKNLNNPVTYET
jgi:D-alanine-D-alanine ligase